MSDNHSLIMAVYPAPEGAPNVLGVSRDRFHLDVHLQAVHRAGRRVMAGRGRRDRQSRG